MLETATFSRAVGKLPTRIGNPSDVTANRRKFDPNINYYEILDVPYSADRNEITRAYRHSMRYAHPDRHADTQDRAKAEERAKLLNAAYAVLGRPDVRREYDRVFRQKAVSEAIFQRYTGNTPGQHATRPRRPPIDPELRRQQHRANRSAFFQIMLFAAICAVTVIVLIVAGSALIQAVGWIV
jgi:curved DNA-binding protein CbpA